MSKMNEYYEETRASYLAAVIGGIETGCISQQDMEVLHVPTHPPPPNPPCLPSTRGGRRLRLCP